MHFELLQSVSLNGSFDRTNEDRFGVSAKSAWVIDGATDLAQPGLLKHQGGAEWIASTANIALANCMEADVTSSCCWLFEHLAERFESAKQRHLQAAWELPTAAFALAQITDEELQIAWAADCYILHMSNSSCTWCTEDPQTRNEAAEANALGVGIGAQKVRSETTIQNRRQKRCQKNYRALSPDIEMSHRSTNYSSCSIQNGDNLLIMSDGFASLVGDYGAYDKKSLAAAVQKKGLAELAKELRDIEQDDAECLKFPRFKLGDDATALWVRIAG